MLEREWEDRAERDLAKAKQSKMEKQASGSKLLRVLQIIKTALSIGNEAEELKDHIEHNVEEIKDATKKW